MANKPIIDIEVNDESFKRFYALFHEYQEKLEEMPESWKKLDKAMGGAGKGFKAASAQTKEALALGAANAAMIVEALNKGVHAQKRFQTATRHSTGAMKKLASESAKVGKTIFGITKYLFKIGGIGTGLAGLGSLWGIDKLAESAFSQQRQARGLGMSIGARRAFSANMSRYVDANALLGNVANAKNDQSKWWAFSAMGIPPHQALSEGTQSLSMQLINRARDIWKKGPQTTQYAKAKGLTQFFTMEDLRRLASSSGKGLMAAEEASRRNTSAYALSNGAAGQWSMLAIQMHKAGVVIETALIRALTPLTPKLRALSHEFAKFIATFAKSGDMEKMVRALASGIGDFAKYIGSPKFRADMKSFENGIVGMGRMMESVLKFFGFWHSDTVKKGATEPHWQKGPGPSPNVPSLNSKHNKQMIQQMLHPNTGMVQRGGESSPQFGGRIDPDTLSVLREIAKQRSTPIRVIIENKTGANVSVSANAAAH